MSIEVILFSLPGSSPPALDFSFCLTVSDILDFLTQITHFFSNAVEHAFKRIHVVVDFPLRDSVSPAFRVVSRALVPQTNALCVARQIRRVR